MSILHQCYAPSAIVRFLFHFYLLLLKILVHLSPLCYDASKYSFVTFYKSEPLKIFSKNLILKLP